MISYNNSDVIQCLRQYEMFANSLNLVKTDEQKDMIIKQLTKLEEKIINLTNDIYEEEYYILANKKCGLLDDEKNRVTMLIDLINQRLSYIEKRCNSHYELTGETIDIKEVLGANQLDNLENNVRVIDKYIKNVKLAKELENDVKSLNSKLSLAEEKISINKSLNVELEATFKRVLDGAFSELSLYDLTNIKNDIEYAYYETEKLLTLAGVNLEIAKTSPISILNDCEEMYNDISKDYTIYKDKINILKLIEIFNDDVSNYDELLNKRKEINEIIKYIKNKELLDMISDTINKQFDTIIMEGQDINTYNDLILERDRKLEALKEIDEENNSEEFQSILKVLIENEKKKQEKLLEEQRKIEEIEKRKKIEIERKKQEEILKRQKIIEEARKKEIERRTKQMLEEQQNSVLQSKRRENVVSFETIKDESLDKKKENQEIDTNNQIVENKEETLLFKNKIDIEKELFDEFNEKSNISDNEVNNKPIEIDLNSFMKEDNDELEDNNKLPDMSIDDYMKNFDENKVDNDIDNLFSEEDFPNIPM